MFRSLIRVIDSAITLVVSLALVTSGLYAGYALWDNHQIYSEAEGTQLEMLRFKPRAVVNENGEVEPPSFEDLLAINPDVCAWLTLDNTGVDYPVLQGVTNLQYINTDVYGKFALSGSIFLDVRCNRDMTNPYSLIYGHHMSNHAMFGDLDLYKDPLFFKENTTGTLLVPGLEYGLKIAACMVTEASDDTIFEPDTWANDLTGLEEYCETNALNINEDVMTELKLRIEEDLDPRVIALSTCSAEYTNARTILIALIDTPMGESETQDVGESDDSNSESEECPVLS